MKIDEIKKAIRFRHAATPDGQQIISAGIVFESSQIISGAGFAPEAKQLEQIKEDLRLNILDGIYSDQREALRDAVRAMISCDPYTGDWMLHRDNLMRAARFQPEEALPKVSK